MGKTFQRNDGNMKIVYLYPTLTTMGGADRIIIQKANYLAEKMGHDVYIITDSQGNRPVVFPLSSRVKHIDIKTCFNKQYELPFFLRIFYYQMQMRKYRSIVQKLLSQIKPDIAISTLGRDSEFFTKLKDGSKKIGEVHTTRRNLRNIQGLLEQKGLQHISGLFLKRKIEKVVRELDAFVVLNNNEKEAWQDIRIAEVIPNSLPFYPEQPSTLEYPKVLCVSRLEYEKGIDRLIEVWQIVCRKHPEWKLDIIGEGTLQEYLQNLIKENELESYIHLKSATQNIEEQYQKNSMLVMTSRFEGFPMVLLEAMGYGLPCVCYDCPYGPRSIIENGKNGFLIKEGEKELMADKICLLIENESMRKNMGKNAYKDIRKFSQKNIMEKWEDLFQSLNQ